MTIGAFGAWLIIQFSQFKQFFTRLKKPQIALLYLSFFLIYFFRDEWFMTYHQTRIFERLFIAILILFIILEQNYSSSSFFKMAKFKRISKLGEITYGLYCLHFIGILIAVNITNMLFEKEQLWHIIIVDTIIAFSISLIISKISYKYFESPFLKLKKRFSYISK
jgi:peptidoglycan/LPS O-acetylase OafA/YrhL